MNIADVIESVFEGLERAGYPLDENQQMILAGQMAGWLQQAIDESAKNTIKNIRLMVNANIPWDQP